MAQDEDGPENEDEGTTDASDAAENAGEKPDLCGIVTHIRKPELANDEVTRLFLDTGEALLLRYFTADNDDRTVAEALYERMLQWVSRPAVSQLASKSSSPIAGRATQSAFRHRWPEQMHFLRDLIAYVMREEQWHAHLSESTERSYADLSALPLDEAVERIAYREARSQIDRRTYRIQTVFQTVAPKDPEMAASVRDIYALSIGAWTRFYRNALEELGLSLRPDVSVEDLANALNVAADGLSIRLLVGDDPSVIDHDRQRSILGLIAIALVVACIDAGDGTPLRKLLRNFDPRHRPDDEASGSPS
jgi:hypothetical protein